MKNYNQFDWYIIFNERKKARDMMAFDKKLKTNSKKVASFLFAFFLLGNVFGGLISLPFLIADWVCSNVSIVVLLALVIPSPISIFISLFF